MNDLFRFAPVGADSLKQSKCTQSNLQWFKGEKIYMGSGRYENSTASKWQTVATRPQPERKTVEDSVEWNRSVEYGDDWYYTSMDVITFSEGKFAYSSHLHTKKDIICTREEFEACVAAKSEPEWTHLHMGEKCKILYSQPDFEGFILTDTEEYGYQLYKLEDLDPIKPTISKAEAWDKLMQNKMNSSEVNTLKQKYTITD